MQPVIRVDNLSKLYRIGSGRSASYRTLRESVSDSALGLWYRWRKSPTQKAAERSSNDFWALRDVSLSIEPGQAVGIIGRNGAGKSTLMKVLSRITEPTAGRIELRGRIGSLLEVGTGFHPELTGRENIFLNGSILGMTRREIERTFDDIVAFAEVERFLDTPVKRYSSGMYVRLAFAVAAHLEPEILLVDEVLAVGDVAFQKKCLGKMGEVSRSGRTVLLVSHQLAAVESLCTRCLLFEGGRLEFDGDTRTALQRYQTRDASATAARSDLRQHQGRSKGYVPTMTEVSLGGSAAAGSGIRMGDPLEIRVRFDASMPLRPVLGVVVKTSMGLPLFGINNRLVPAYQFEECTATGMIACRFDSLPLMPGSYQIDLFFGDQFRDVDAVREAISFDVLPADVFGSGKLPGTEAGPFCLPASWTLDSESACHSGKGTR